MYLPLGLKFLKREYGWMEGENGWTTDWFDVMNWVFTLFVNTNHISYCRCDVFEHITGLHPEIPCHFAWHLSVPVSQKLRPYYLSVMFVSATVTDEYWHLHSADCKKTLMITTSRTLLLCDISLGFVKLPAPKAEHSVVLILLNMWSTRCRYSVSSTGTRRYSKCLLSPAS
jgi:hypothetical protein